MPGLENFAPVKPAKFFFPQWFKSMKDYVERDANHEKGKPDFFGKKGKNAWKQFDMNFFYYFRDVTHMMDTQDYIRIVKDIFKKPSFHVAWQAKDYLKKIELF